MDRLEKLAETLNALADSTEQRHREDSIWWQGRVVSLRQAAAIAEAWVDGFEPREWEKDGL